MLNQLYTTLLYQPLLNVLIFFYDYSPGRDIGIAIVLLTLLVKLVLYPLSRQAIKGQQAMASLQPKLDELKKRFPEKDKQAQEMMKLYKEEKINPLSSCLPLLIQLPFLIAVYQVFSNGLGSKSFDLLYSFVPNPGTINTLSLGFLDLSKASIPLAILAGLAQFWQAKMMPMRRPPKGMPGAKDEDMAALMNKQMMYMMPAMTVVIGMSLPGGLSLYWLVMTALTALQQQVMMRKRPVVVVGQVQAPVVGQGKDKI